jgi:calcineurin-like phosphoesterase family protein
VSLLFTSDTHFFHRSQIARRGFDSAEHMHEVMVEAWNSAVRPSDTVYHLGDLSFGKPYESAELICRLNGAIKLIPGNHDLHSNGKPLRELFGMMEGGTVSPMHREPKLERLERLHTLKVSRGDETLRIELCHFPLLVWDRGHYGALHLHGHSHGNCKYPDPGTTRMDVGVDAVGYAPLSLDEVLQEMSKRKLVPHDHHVEGVKPSAVAP